MNNKPRNTKPTKWPKRWIKQLSRLLVIVLMAAVAIIFSLYILLRLLYPPEKLKEMAKEAVTKSTNRTLQVGDVYIHPLRGFVFNEVRLGLQGDTLATDDIFPLRNLYFKKIELKYSLRHLLKRKLIIKEIDLQSPDLELFVDMTTPSAIDLAALMRMDFGFNIQLRKLLFEDAKFKIILGYAYIIQNIYIDHFSCYLNSVQLPRGGIVYHDSLFMADIILTSEKCKCLLEQINLTDGSYQSTQGVVDLDLFFGAKTFSDLTLKLDVLATDLTITERTVHKNQQATIGIPIYFNVGLHADMKHEKACLDSLVFGFERTPWLRLTAQMDSLFSTANFEAKVIESRIPIAQLLRLLQPWLSPDMVSRLQLKNPRAYFSLEDTKVKGSLKKEINFAGRFRLTPLGVNLCTDASSYFIDGFALEAVAEGVYTAEGVRRIDLVIDSRYDTLDVFSQQQPIFYTGHGGIKVQAQLNRELLPNLLTCQLAIGNIMGGKVRGDLALGTTSSLRNLTGGGYLRIYDLELDRFVDGDLMGDAAIRLDFSIKTLNDIKAQLSLNTSSLTMPQEDDPLIFPPINFNIQSYARVDARLQHVQFDTLKIELNNILAAKLNGTFIRDGTMISDLNVHEFILNHQAIMEFIPETLRERWSEPQFLGTTHLKAQAHATIKDGDIVYNAKGHLFSNNTSFHAPSKYLALVGLNLDAAFDVDSHGGGEFYFQLELDSLRNSAIGTVSFAKNRMKFGLKSADFHSLEIKDGLIELPDLFTTGQFSALVKNLPDRPQIESHFRLQQDVRDTLRLPMNMRMTGRSDFQFDVKMDSSVAKIRLDIWSDALSFLVSQNTTLQNLEAQLSLSQDIDLLGKRLVTSRGYSVNTPSSALMDYLVYRGYYQNEALPRSSLRIDRIDFSGYRIEDIFLELFIKDGRVEIPTLMAKMYGGHIAGRMAINLAEGDLTRAEYTINAHFTNINSNLILPLRKGETQKGILNGNLDLQGFGLDPASEFNIQGQIYLTEIGPRVADNILRSLDPQGKDSGIRTTRLLINRGFKPKLMTFVLRHGYLYPTIVFDQPWYLPVRLSGGKVELARIPLEFFIKSRTQTTMTP